MSHSLSLVASEYIRHATQTLIKIDNQPGFTRYIGQDFVCALDIRPPVVRIIAFGVHETARRRKLGSALLSGIHHFCREQQLIPLVLLVRDSHDAISFWQYHGYTPCRDDPDCWMIPGWHWDQCATE